MRLHPALVAACLIAALPTCTAPHHERPDASPEKTPASAESGDVVHDLSDHLWIVFQDKKKTYWFGSDGEGVYRYDGQTIRRYTTRHGLCNDHIRQILEDESGNLYFNTCGGISKFDGRSFSTLIPTQSDTPTGGWKLKPDDLWFKGTQDDNGPLRYDGQSLLRLEFPRHELEDKFRSKFPSVPYSPYGIYVVSKDSKGSIWFGTACFGACRFDGKSFTWVSESDMTELDDGPAFGVRGIAEDKDGKFWLSNTAHRYDVYPSDSTAQAHGGAKYGKEQGIGRPGVHTKLDDSYFVSGLKGRDDALWMATYGAGVWRYDGQNLITYPVANGDEPALVFSIYEDRAGVLWLGTTGTGVFRFNGKAFERFRP